MQTRLNISKPTILIDPTKVRKNIDKIARSLSAAGAEFRPHFKTHQSAHIGEWFRDYGVEAITVSSLSMARYFAEHGWQDITVAFPVNRLEIDLINSLAEKITLHLILDRPEVAEFLEKSLSNPVKVWIEADTGYGRSGAAWTQPQEIVALAESIHRSRRLSFMGLLTHAGQSYNARTPAAIRSIYAETVSRLSSLKQTLLDAGAPRCLLSIGDTPCCSVVDDFSGVDEIRPGNFVFYDLAQVQIGACTSEEIAMVVACPVVGQYPSRRQIVIYGGAVHFSKDSIVNEQGTPIFGYLAQPYDDGSWGPAQESVSLISLSQEHGQAAVESALFDQIEGGQVLPFLPVHSCLTANLHRTYLTLDGEVIESFCSTF